jgi:hypothetical protein
MVGLRSHHLPRAAGAALGSLLGPSRAARRRPADSYATLAEALADALPKELQQELADALGVTIADETPEPEPQPEPAPDEPEPDWIAWTFGLVDGEGGEAKRGRPSFKPIEDDDGAMPPVTMADDLGKRFKIESGYVDENGRRYVSARDYLREKRALARKRLRRELPDAVGLVDEILTDPHGKTTPSLIARAALYDAVMLHGDRDFRKRFDGVFGKGASDRILSGDE